MNRLQSTIVPTLVTLLLHGGLVFLLVWHWKPSESRRVSPKIPKFVEAKLVVRPTPEVKAPAKKAPAKTDKPTKVKKAEKKPAAQKTVKVPEKKKTQTPSKTPPKVAKPTSKKPTPKDDQNAAADAKRVAEAKAKARREAERKRRAELDALLAEEDAFLEAQSDQEVVIEYAAYIKDRIENNWNRPASARAGMEVELLIRLVPTGQVVGVDIVRSSGNEAFDRSAEQAVNKVGRFERLQQLSSQIFERQFRSFNLVFNPKDLK